MIVDRSVTPGDGTGDNIWPAGWASGVRMSGYNWLNFSAPFILFPTSKWLLFRCTILHSCFRQNPADILAFSWSTREFNINQNWMDEKFYNILTVNAFFLIFSYLHHTSFINGPQGSDKNIHSIFWHPILAHTWVEKVHPVFLYLPSSARKVWHCIIPSLLSREGMKNWFDWFRCGYSYLNLADHL